MCGHTIVLSMNDRSISSNLFTSKLLLQNICTYALNKWNVTLKMCIYYLLKWLPKIVEEEEETQSLLEGRHTLVYTSSSPVCREKHAMTWPLRRSSDKNSHDNNTQTLTHIWRLLVLSTSHSTLFCKVSHLIYSCSFTCSPVSTLKLFLLFTGMVLHTLILVCFGVSNKCARWLVLTRPNVIGHNTRSIHNNVKTLKYFEWLKQS